MKHTLKKENNVATFTLTIPQNLVEEGMKQAAQELSQDMKIPGFRPGKAPYDVIKQQVGEMKLLEACAENLIRSAFSKAMMEEDLETVGQPFFNAEKFAPGNDLVITAEIALFPKVTKLTDYKKVKIKNIDAKPKKEHLDEAKKDLARMQMKETPAKKGSKLKKGDKAVISLTMKKDGVVLEGGEGQAHGVYTNEPYYVEGFIDQIIGMSIDETKSFNLKFPKDHYQKHLAGQPVDFEVTLKEIHHVETPEINDDFAKKIGLKDLKDLEEKLQENLKKEREHEEMMRQEREVIDALVDKSTFEKIPDILVNQELNKMVEEIKNKVEEQGLDMDTYLKQINKTLADLKLDFTPTAIKRIKASIVVKEVAKLENIEATDEQLDQALDDLAARYPDEKSKEVIYSPNYREMMSHQMKNKLVIDHLIALATKK